MVIFPVFIFSMFPMFLCSNSSLAICSLSSSAVRSMPRSVSSRGMFKVLPPPSGISAFWLLSSLPACKGCHEEHHWKPYKRINLHLGPSTDSRCDRRPREWHKHLKVQSTFKLFKLGPDEPADGQGDSRSWIWIVVETKYIPRQPLQHVRQSYWAGLCQTLGWPSVSAQNVSICISVKMFKTVEHFVSNTWRGCIGKRLLAGVSNTLIIVKEDFPFVSLNKKKAHTWALERLEVAGVSKAESEWVYH